MENIKEITTLRYKNCNMVVLLLIFIMNLARMIHGPLSHSLNTSDLLN